jgi:hypothetical protein
MPEENDPDKLDSSPQNPDTGAVAGDSISQTTDAAQNTPATDVTAVSTQPTNNFQTANDVISPEREVKTYNPKPVKKWLIAAVVAVFILILAAGGYFLFMNQKVEDTVETPAAETPIEARTFKARVIYKTGDVFKLVEDKEERIEENALVSEGDTIMTGKDSRVVLSFDEGSVVRLDSETKLTVEKAVSGLMKINNLGGIVFARVDKDENHLFQITADEVSIEALGTAYSVEKTDEVKVMVFESEVKVKTQSEETKLTTNQQWSSKDNKVLALNVNEVQKNEFYDWSLKEEKLAVATPVPTKSPSPTSKPTTAPSKEDTSTGSYIKLSANATDSGIKLQWKVQGVDTSKGFKVVKNSSGSPSYPGDHAVFVDAGSSYYLWKITDGKTWHFRVCQFTDGKCGVYSNSISITAKETQSGGVNSISLKLTKLDSGVTLNWTVDGYAEKGFKVVWSKASSPTYPNREGDSNRYLSDPNKRDETVTGLDTGSTYYFRVCEYTGSGCRAYSNEVSASF